MQVKYRTYIPRINCKALFVCFSLLSSPVVCRNLSCIEFKKMQNIQARQVRINRGPFSDINECNARNGHGPCQDKCINLVGSYKCTCDGMPGTRLAADGHTCENVVDCSQRNGGCSHACIDTLGKCLKGEFVASLHMKWLFKTQKHLFLCEECFVARRAVINS